jgi:hypothetical protein
VVGNHALNGLPPPTLDRGVAGVITCVAQHLRDGHDRVAQRRRGRVAELDKPGITLPSGLAQPVQVALEDRRLQVPGREPFRAARGAHRDERGDFLADGPLAGKGPVDGYGLFLAICPPAGDEIGPKGIAMAEGVGQAIQGGQ